MAPALVLLTFGTYDLADSIQISLRLERAVRAGAQYALANPTDETAIKSQVLAAWPELAAAEVSIACVCGGNPMVSCAVACDSGSARTIAVSAKRSTTPLLLRYVSGGAGHAVVRLR
jgi:hypothetical protein